MDIIYRGRVLSFYESSEKWCYEQIWFKTLKAAKAHIDSVDLSARRIPNIPVYFGYYEKQFGHAVLREGNSIWIRKFDGSRTKAKLTEVFPAITPNDELFNDIECLCAKRDAISKQISELRDKYVKADDSFWDKFDGSPEKGDGESTEEGKIPHIPV